MSRDTDSNYPGGGSDSEEDDELDVTQYPCAAQWHLEDIEKLKEQTNSLLDPTWKQGRNTLLLRKMLSLDHPTVTTKMVDFLQYDHAVELLVGFITQNGSTGPRPGPEDTFTESMKLAYKAVILLSPDKLSDALTSILNKKVTIIVRKLFDIFNDDSAGSFYHAYRLFDSLLRTYPSETLDAMYTDGLLPKRFESMMRNIGFSPVCELIVMMVSLSPVARTTVQFTACQRNRSDFLDALNDWNILQQLANCVVNPEAICECSNPLVSADQHSTTSALLLQDIVEKVSLEDIGEKLLSPFGKSSAIVDTLMIAMLDSNAALDVRRSSARVISFLLLRAAEAEIMCYVASQTPNKPPSTVFIPNRLYVWREHLVSYIRLRINDLCDVLIHFDEFVDSRKAAFAEDITALKFNSYEVGRPFTVLRQLLIEVLVLCVESDETVAEMVPLDLWKLFISWALRYPHNNVYHSLFYRLVFAVLRQGQEIPQRILFQKAKFATFLVDNFVPYSKDENGSVVLNEPPAMGTKFPDSMIKKIAVRGLIMNCANALRFQLNAQSTNSFLSGFLSSHTKWNEFLPSLTVATDLQMHFGMGVRVSNVEFKPGGGLIVHSSEPLDEPNPSNRFAKSLGFFEDAPWSLHPPTRSLVTDELDSFDDDVFSEDSGRFSYLASDSMDMSMEEDEPDSLYKDALSAALSSAEPEDDEEPASDAVDAN